MMSGANLRLTVLAACTTRATTSCGVCSVFVCFKLSQCLHIFEVVCQCISV